MLTPTLGHWEEKVLHKPVLRPSGMNQALQGHGTGGKQVSQVPQGPKAVTLKSQT